VGVSRFSAMDRRATAHCHGSRGAAGTSQRVRPADRGVRRAEPVDQPGCFLSGASDHPADIHRLDLLPGTHLSDSGRHLRQSAPGLNDVKPGGAPRRNQGDRNI